MRTYITPVKLNRRCPDILDTCIKCSEGKGTLYHCVWECPKLNKYWKTVVEKISEVVGVKVPHQAKLCILGIYPGNFTVSSKQSILIDFGLLQARRMIALSWKNTVIPLIHVWVKEMASCLVLERLTYITRGKAKEFEKVWRPLLEFLGHQRAQLDIVVRSWVFCDVVILLFTSLFNYLLSF